MSQSSKSIIAMSVALLFAVACHQPRDERPGMWLRGSDATEFATDWRFTDPIEEIFVETRTLYGLRHSTTIWCAELDGRLYIGSYDEEVKFWERNVARNPRARLRIENAIYDVMVTPLDSEELTGKLDERYATKYDMADVFGDELPTWRYYRVAPRAR